MTFIVTTDLQIDRITAPRLPAAPKEYESRYHDQFADILRLYFNRLDGVLARLSTLSVPYGAFSSDQDQTALVNTATAMTFNTTDFANGVSIASSKITVATAGIYNLQFSAQFVNTDTAFQDVYIWLRQDGADIPGSTGFVSIPNRHAGTDGHAIVGWNYFLSMTAGQYIEIYWSVPNAAVSIQHLAASGTPTKPSTQSVVATMTFVSALPHDRLDQPLLCEANMSLQLAAKHLADKGRGPDSTLVHMSPKEVNSLQELAMAHGGSLSVNPQTGLPEAGFLSSILPMVAGAALMATGVGAPMAAMMVGGGMTVATGSLQKGLMAGLGAYGGAGLASGLLGAGAGAAGAEAAGSGLLGAIPEAATNMAGPAAFGLEEGLAQTAGAGMSQAAPNLGMAANLPTQAEIAGIGYDPSSMVEGLGYAPPTPPAQAGLAPTTPMPTQDAVGMLGTPGAPPPSGFGDRMAQMGRGVGALGTSEGRGAFMSGVGGSKGLMQAGLAAAAPMMLGQTETAAYKGGPNPYKYRFDYNKVEDPEEDYKGARTGERRYFNPAYTRLAGGGPVEEMSLSNVYDMQNARGGVSDMGIDNSTGMQRMARGGLSHLGDYSDGGRLLRGPGDGVSDSIPATIGNKQPARLADGEFVVPARIVSELGNGSTEAGARKLYAMMNRVQKARGKTTGKNKVATNTRAEKYLPA